MPPSSKSRNHPRSSDAGPQGEEKVGAKVIPVVQEELSVSSETTETGRAVRVRIASEEQRAHVPVTEIIEEVSIERVPINQYVEKRTAAREEGDVVVIPVFETVAVVEMRLLLKEEVRIVRHRREVLREEEVVLRKERPIIERKASSQDEWREDSQDQ